MKRLLLLVVVLMLAGFYVGWPAWSGYQISQALKTHDAHTLERKIDFTSVRVGIRPIVASEVDKALDRMQRDPGSLTGTFAAALRKDLAPRFVDVALQTFVTPDNVVRMVQHGGSVRDFVRQSIAEQTGRSGRRGAPSPGADPSGSADAEPSRRSGGLAGMMERLGRPGGHQGAREEPPSTTTATMPPAPAAPAAVPPPAPPPTTEASVSASPGEGMRGPRYSYANIKHFRITGPLSFEIGFNRRAEANDPEVIAEMAFRGGDWKVVRVIPRIEP